jgi:16S rRNA (cytidine1402-2'-O)-methyltransferase
MPSSSVIVGVATISVERDMEQAGDGGGSRAAGLDRVGGTLGTSGAGTGGTLALAAVPIGRPDDASPRLAAALAAAPVVAAEDTRRLRRLTSALGVRLSGRVISYYDAVEAARTPHLLAELQAGRDVLLVTDAGLPGISDPGYRLVAAAAAAGIRVSVLPGPSAVTAALAVSGLPSDRFCFEGFPPRRAGERARRFAELADEPRTLIFFESPRRLGTTLTGLGQALGGGRPAVVCRELTKTHEEIRRGTLAELAAWAAAGTLGEITIVVAGAPERARRGASGAAPQAAAAAAAEVAAREQTGTSRRDAIAAVARERGLPKRAVYDAVVRPGASPP